MDKKTIPELDDLAEQIGEFIRYWGFKKVHGQIWLHLFLAAEPLDAGALMKRLKISKALASMSLSDLLEYKVILLQGKSKSGTQLYATNPNLMEAILNVLRTRERKMLSRIQAGYKDLKKLSAEEKKNINSEKLRELGEFLEAGEALLDAYLQFKDVDFSLWAKFLGPK